MFYDYCEKAGIKEHQYHSAITIVLTGKAEEYYYLALTEGTNERKVGYLCTAVQQVPEARMTLHAPPADYKTLCSQLRVNRTYNGKGKEARVDDDISDSINEIDEVNHAFFALPDSLT
ncbi:hypothetical protein CKAH01_08038 [Colletotrichum kahawae]|uniref:Uncharacterized protein n=1 Tax=Colletotrichum kahawae TaxID=34407 RepID=A0AAD9Y4E7_COLKA|nr:hypothetical protein CKAH01_08038 [Colletotrichum kahawae]